MLEAITGPLCLAAYLTLVILFTLVIAVAPGYRRRPARKEPRP